MAQPVMTYVDSFIVPATVGAANVEASFPRGRVWADIPFRKFLGPVGARYGTMEFVCTLWQTMVGVTDDFLINEMGLSYDLDPRKMCALFTCLGKNWAALKIPSQKKHILILGYSVIDDSEYVLCVEREFVDGAEEITLSARLPNCWGDETPLIATTMG